MISSNNWRSTSSLEAFNLITEHSANYGLKRLADLTSLDFLNIPVYIGLRPRGKTLCVSAGKGLTHIDSIVSAAMESIEIDVAERVDNLVTLVGCFNELPQSSRVPFELIPYYSRSHFNPYSTATWVPTKGIATGKSFYYPAALISLNKSCLKEPLNTFPWSSNGLASGLTHDDAVLSGLYEVIERDAWSCWEFFASRKNYPLPYVVDETVPFPSTRNLISRIRSAGLDLILNPLPTEFSVPAFRCLLLNSYDHAGAISLGFGCHHSDEIALNRAITEAVQARAVYISGARDDIVAHSILSSNAFDISCFKANFIPEPFFPAGNPTMSADIAISTIIESFASHDLHEPLVYTFDDPGPFTVVRVVCPSLTPSGGRKGHAPTSHPRYKQFSPPINGIGNLFLSSDF